MSDVQLAGILWYRAPHCRTVSPKVIESATEYLELMVGGTVYFEVDGELQPFRYGTLFWHLPEEQTVCMTEPDDPYECIVFKFRREGPMCRRWPRATRLVDRVDACEFGRRMLTAFHDERHDKGALGRYAYSWLEWHARESVLAEEQLGVPSTIRPLLVLIDKHPDRDFCIEEMGRICGLSAPHLHTLFKRHLQTTPHQYVLRQRLDRARHRIVSTNDPVKQISAECGFANVETFYRGFKKRYGTSPGEFRKRNRPS